MLDFLKEADELSARLIEIRRDIHAHPELGRHEKRTAGLIVSILADLGLDARVCAETGICAQLTGAHDGPVIALRADMDALPITESTDHTCRSMNDGVMHACGHDVHTAALLGAAMLLSRHRDELRGSVRFLFQPDEEGDGGAQRMIDDGALDGVSAIYAAHVAPEIPCGRVGIRYGNAYAASNPFDLTVYGTSSHGAEPDLGNDAIIAAAHIVTAVQTVVSRSISPLESAVVSIGSFHAGTARNIIADRAELKGVIRCFGSDMRRKVIDLVTRTVNGTAAALGVKCDLNFRWGYSGIINCDSETEHVHNTLESLFGKEQVVLENAPSMTTEDFGAFLEHVPGCYWHIGVGKPDCGNAPLHSPLFDPDERAIALAAAAHAQIVWKRLGSQKTR